MDVSGALPVGVIFGNYTTVGLLVVSLVALSLSAYVKIAVVLGILRAGLGFASIPSAFVTGALALALSYCVMYPVLHSSTAAMERVLQSAPTITDQTRVLALQSGLTEWSKFLSAHTDPEELARFQEASRQLTRSKSGTQKSANATVATGQVAPALDSSGLQILAPAFLLSQLKDAFRIGLRIFLPFLVIDILVGILISAVGIDRYLSVSIGFASKLLLFVVCDGWALIAGSLVTSYAT